VYLLVLKASPRALHVSRAGRGVDRAPISLHMIGIQQRPGGINLRSRRFALAHRQIGAIASVQCGYGESSQEGEIL
jgi:hypothetical protein